MEGRRFPKVSQVSPDSRPAVLLRCAPEVVPVEAVGLCLFPQVAGYQVDKGQAFLWGFFHLRAFGDSKKSSKCRISVSCRS